MLERGAALDDHRAVHALVVGIGQRGERGRQVADIGQAVADEQHALRGCRLRGTRKKQIVLLLIILYLNLFDLQATTSKRTGLLNCQSS